MYGLARIFEQGESYPSYGTWSDLILPKRRGNIPINEYVCNFGGFVNPANCGVPSVSCDWMCCYLLALRQPLWQWHFALVLNCSCRPSFLLKRCSNWNVLSLPPYSQFACPAQEPKLINLLKPFHHKLANYMDTN
jgi:hypothetical protein